MCITLYLNEYERMKIYLIKGKLKVHNISSDIAFVKVLNHGWDESEHPTFLISPLLSISYANFVQQYLQTTRIKIKWWKKMYGVLIHHFKKTPVDSRRNMGNKEIF